MSHNNNGALSRLSQDKKQIRLLSFSERTSVQADEPLSLNPTVVNLDDAPPFVAISYEWGPPTPTKSIYLGGKSTLIRKNLFTFLEAYRTRQEEGFLWIDALCIDQSSLSERNHQVKLMGEIFAKAFRVIAWLGAGPPSLIEAIRELSRADRFWPVLLTPFFKDYWAEGSMQNKKRLQNLDEVLGLVPPQDLFLVLSCVAKICESTYWTRMWIIQEIVLARTVDMYCANETLPFDAFKLFLLPELLNTHVVRGDSQDSESSIMQARDRASITVSYAARIESLRSGREEVCKDGIRSERLIRELGVSQCADARDRIYALLGLIDKGELTSFPIQPNYSKSASKLFLELCVRQLRIIRAEDGMMRDWADLGDFPLNELQEKLGLADDDESVEFVRHSIARSQARGRTTWAADPREDPGEVPVDGVGSRIVTGYAQILRSMKQIFG